MKVSKAYEITDAKIQFVSLVDKAANLKRFLITKAADGQASFSTYGRIIAKDAEHHFLTGVVYEPLAEDAHGNFMTEAEITKAAYYFAKAGGQVDLQHSFEPLAGAAVVESWIAKADFDIDGEPVKKGTWLMTVELADEKLWEAVEKGEITGFSMGGVGKYSEEDVDLETVSKAETGVQPEEKKGILKRLAEMLGMEIVEKGEVADTYAERTKTSNFWTAFGVLQDTLSMYDYYTNKTWLESDEGKIKEALKDFNTIVTSILTSGESIQKALKADEKDVIKVGKKMSGKNKETLQGIYDTLGTFLASFDDPEEEQEDPDKKKPAKCAEEAQDEGDNPKQEEEEEVKKSEVEKLVQESVAEAVKKALEATEPAGASEEPVTAEAVQKMVEEAVAKALTPPEAEEPVTAESIKKMVTEAVNKAVAPVLKARGVPSALNDEDGGESVEKGEQHYLHGIL